MACPGGWSTYKVRKDVYQDALFLSEVSNWVAQQVASAPCCSSSDLNFNKTTTTATRRVWDFSKLDRNLLPKELASKTLDEFFELFDGDYENFQKAIYQVSHLLDLKRKNGGVNSPAGFVLGVLKKGPEGISESPGFSEWLKRKKIERILREMNSQERVRLHTDLGKLL